MTRLSLPAVLPLSLPLSLHLVLPLVLSLLALPLHAETLSAEIGRTGLLAVETRLSALPAPSDEDRFTLGGVHFLRALEISFQDRWREGLTDRSGLLPFLRLPLSDNPAPAAFQPGTIRGIFHKAGDQLALAQTVLTAIPETSDFAADIALDDLWLDVNADGRRDPDEGLVALLGQSLALPAPEDGSPPPPVTIRFDVADAAWLAAYADMLGALCNLVQAYDPTEPITRVLSARAQMAALGPVTPDPFFGTGFGLDFEDLAAIVLASQAQSPDKARMAAVQAGLLDMVAQNRAFWTRVARETDDADEWLPNAHQRAALGIEVPPEAGAQWLAVLDEMEAVLRGETLIPFWRVGAPAGVNLALVFTDPRPVDLAGWIQGWAALPYLQTGKPLADGAALAAFDAAMTGRSMLFALYFN